MLRGAAPCPGGISSAAPSAASLLAAAGVPVRAPSVHSAAGADMMLLAPGCRLAFFAAGLSLLHLQRRQLHPTRDSQVLQMDPARDRPLLQTETNQWPSMKVTTLCTVLWLLYKDNCEEHHPADSTVSCALHEGRYHTCLRLHPQQPPCALHQQMLQHQLLLPLLWLLQKVAMTGT